MNITSSSIVYRFFTTFLFFTLAYAFSIGGACAETDNVVPELSTNATDADSPIWDGYPSSSASTQDGEGYEKPIATIVPSTKNVIQGDIVYFRLQYENAGSSFYWIMEDQRSADRALRVDTSKLKLGKYRVRVSVTNKARQQASSQVFFEVLANANNTATTKPQETPVAPIDYQGNTNDTPSQPISDNSDKASSVENIESTEDNEDDQKEDDTFNSITIEPTTISLDQGEIASFKSSTTLSNAYDFRWRFGTQLADLDKFQVSTKDVIPGTYKVYLTITNKAGKKTNVSAQLIVRDPDVEKTTVPDLIGKTLEDVDDELKAVELVQGKIEEKEVTENQGKIIKQLPKAGTEVNVNSKVYLVVGVGVEIEVIDVVGKDIEAAKTLLDKRSFSVAIEKKIANEEEEEVVLSQSPKAGTTLKQGETITLVIAEKEVITKVEPSIPVTVTIKTTTPSVEQGANVEFNAEIKNAIKDEDYNYQWTFGKQTSNKKTFVVQTDQLALGKHTIKVHISDNKDNDASNETALEIRAKRLLVPTLTGLSLGEAQSLIKKTGLLLGTIKEQQGDVKKATIKKQSPASGDSVSVDQRINLVVVIPKKVDPVRVDIRFDKTTGKIGEAIVLTTKVTTKTKLNDLHYIYSINNAKKASVDARFTWLPEAEGAYTIFVTAYNEEGAVAKSEPYVIDVDTGWEKPVAKLLPENAVIKQGDSIMFTSNSTYDLNSTLQYEWISSSGHSGSEKMFSIDATDVNAGEYDITLTITDDNKNQSTATAQLVIQEVLESPDNTTNKEKDVVQFSADSKSTEKPTVILNTSRKIVQVGQKIQFNMQVDPQATDILYYYQLGDRKRRQWMKTSAFEHQYDSFGSYSVRAVIKQNGKVYYSDSVTIWVWSSWLLSLVGGLGLFLFIVIWWWTRRIHSDDGDYSNELLHEKDNANKKHTKTKKIETLEEQIPLPQPVGKHDIITEKREREQDSVKLVLIKGITQFILGILLSFVILYIILKLMGLV